MQLRPFVCFAAGSLILREQACLCPFHTTSPPPAWFLASQRSQQPGSVNVPASGEHGPQAAKAESATYTWFSVSTFLYRGGRRRCRLARSARGSSLEQEERSSPAIAHLGQDVDAGKRGPDSRDPSPSGLGDAGAPLRTQGSRAQTLAISRHFAPNRFFPLPARPAKTTASPRSSPAHAPSRTGPGYRYRYRYRYRPT